MKTILLIVLLFAGSAFPEAEEAPSTGTGLFSRLMEMITSSEERSWAKPIEHVDMDRMYELLEAGLVSFHTADWYAEVDEENE